MRNIIKTSKFLSVTLDDNQVLMVTDTSLFDEIMEAAMNNDDIKIVEIIHKPVANETPEMKISTHLKDICSGKIESQYLLYKDNQIFIPSISLLSVPQDFAVAFLDAEFNNDEGLVKTYLNFWTLVSMNPDANVRKDIFWFIRKWDIKISKSGFLICYRNVVSTSRSSSEKEQITKDYIKIKAQKKSPKNYTYSDEGKLIKIDSLDAPDDAKSLKELYDEVTSSSDTPVYTDQYTHTFRIKIGEKVTMPREKCSRDNSVSCSAGLHAGAAGWLERNYFGDTGMMVLINPANVTSIPKLMGIIAVML